MVSGNTTLTEYTWTITKQRLNFVRSHHHFAHSMFSMNTVDDNALTGKLPSEIGLLTGLKNLYLCKLECFVDHLTA